MRTTTKERRIYAAWDILAQHTRVAAREIQQQCGNDVVRFICEKSDLSAALKEEFWAVLRGEKAGQQ